MEVKTVTLLQPSLRVLYHPCSKIDQRGKIIASSSPDTELVLQSHLSQCPEQLIREQPRVAGPSAKARPAP